MNRRIVRKSSLIALTSLFVLVAVVSGAAQVTIHVPADVPTIQAGITAANNGDTVLVAPGTYVENLDFQGKAITVVSANGASATIIDGGAIATVVTFSHGETAAAVLSGFTIRNGRSSIAGGGIAITNASPTIQSNVITGNQAVYGIGIDINGGSPLIQNNVISNNYQCCGTSGFGGGGISVEGGSSQPAAPQILGNTITNNSLSGGGFGGGIDVTYSSSPLIQNNIISGNSAYNYGGGINVESSSQALVVQNIISNNSGGSGGGVSFYAGGGSSVLLNNTLYGNHAYDGSSEIYVSVYDSAVSLINNAVLATAGNALTCAGSVQPTVSHNIIYNQNGVAFAGNCAAMAGTNGNLATDPLFANAASGDFHLQASSPAIDAGDNSAAYLPQKDLDGNPRIADGNGDGNAVIDMGVYEFPGTPGLSSVAVSPTSVTGGASSTGTVALTAPAPSGGMTVTIGSNNAAAVPSVSSLTIPSGSSTGTFTVNTTAVTTTTTATITATYKSTNVQATLTITTPGATLAAVGVNPTSVVGGNGSTGTVTLNNPAPSGGALVSLSSSSASAAVPATVTVTAGSTTATFTVTTIAVAASTPVTITASYDSVNVQTTLTVNPPALAGVSLNPTSVVGGNSSTGTLTLTGPAPTGGISISLQSTNSAATVAASVSVAANATNATFTATTVAVSISTTVTITATYAGVNQTATLTVTPESAPAIDKSVSTDRSTSSSTIVSPAFTTTAGNELLLAFIATDGNAGMAVNSVTGAGLTWSLVKRANTQPGTSEIWRALAPAALSNATVTANLAQSVAASITVVSFTGVDITGSNGSGAIGATAATGAASGAPSASLTTTRNNSWVFGVGNDWDTATHRTVGPNQALVHEYLASVGDTYWVQQQINPTSLSGTLVTINDTAPTADHYNLAIAEILPPSAVTVTYSISGTISGAGGNGATVTLSGGTSSTTTADTSGNYSFSGLANGAYIVTPSKSGFTFTPGSQNVTVNNANVGTVNFNTVTYSISGTISGSGGNGATVTLSGAANASTTASSTGAYTFSNLVNGSYTVTPNNTGYTFTPTSMAVTINGANQTANFSSAPSAPNTIHVPTDQSTIQGAINVANTGDTVLVAPGTYSENISFLGKAITVTSASGASVTIIDGGGKAPVVTFNTGEGPSSVLNGFTIQNGTATFNSQYEGGGIYISYTSPTITNNVIQNNTACADGGGIAVSFGSPQIQGNTIQNNTQSACSGGSGGGGIALLGAGVAQIVGNVIANNTWPSGNGGGISMNGAGTPTIKNNVITGNTATGVSPAAQGGGISMVNDSDPLIVQNLIYNNTAGQGSGVYFGVPSGSRGPILVNNTIVGGSGGSQGVAVYANGYDNQAQLFNNLLIGPSGQNAVYCDGTYQQQPPTFTNNDVFSPSGTGLAGTCSGQSSQNGNISADPQFVNASGGNFHLQPTSPAVDAGTNSAPDLPQTDYAGNPRILDGNNDCVSTIDIGAYELVLSANVSFSTNTLTFASQPIGTSSNPQSVGLSNTGSTCFQFSSIGITGDFSQTNACSAAGVRAGSSCAFNVTFTPTATGPRSGVLAVSGSDGITAGNLTVNLSGTGAAATYSISGTISGPGGNGATVTLSGTASATVTASSTGTYSFSNLTNGSYVVTPSNSGFTFTPPNQGVTVSGANVAGVNFSSAAVVVGLAIDKSVSTDRSTSSSTIVSPAFTTTAGNELLLAFIAADAPSSGTNTAVTSVTGGGLTWALVRRTNTQLGTAEVWRTFAPAVLTNVTITATLSRSVAASITVVTFTGVDTTGTSGSGAIGATASGSAASGAPTASLTTTRNNSLVLAVGSDWDNAIARTVPAGQTMVHQYLASIGDTYWVQRMAATTPTSGTVVTINDTAPTTDRYNFTIVEVLHQ